MTDSQMTFLNIPESISSLKIRTALTATNAGERGNGVPIAVAVT